MSDQSDDRHAVPGIAHGRRLHPASIAASAGRPTDPGAPMNTPLVATSTYIAGGSIGYAREGNPTWLALEVALGAMESGHSVVFSSGLAAINAVLDTVPAAATIIAPDHPYSGTASRLHELEQDDRLQVRRVNMHDTAGVIEAMDGAVLVWLESPTNPLMEIADLRTIIDAARSAHIPVAVDNTFATSLGQQPLELGADYSIQSATKYIGGHSDLLLGVVTTRDRGLAEKLQQRRTLLGSTPGSLETWLALRGLRTLPLRFERACSNALDLASRLQSDPRISYVLYPGLPSHPHHHIAQEHMRAFGGVVSFVIKGDAQQAELVCDSTSLIVHATSLGGIESTIERRGRWAAEHADVPPELIRLSVGIEHVDDIWLDLDVALTVALGRA